MMMMMMIEPVFMVDGRRCLFLSSIFKSSDTISK
jgi:hypothetical protein